MDSTRSSCHRYKWPFHQRDLQVSGNVMSINSFASVASYVFFIEIYKAFLLVYSSAINDLHMINFCWKSVEEEVAVNRRLKLKLAFKWFLSSLRSHYKMTTPDSRWKGKSGCRLTSDDNYEYSKTNALFGPPSFLPCVQLYVYIMMGIIVTVFLVMSHEMQSALWINHS